MEQFAATASQRFELMQEFPRWKKEVQQIEQVWIQQTTEEELDRANAKVKTNPGLVLKRLRDIRDTLRMTEHYQLVSRQLLEARQTAMKAHIASEIEKLSVQVKQGRFARAHDQAVALEADLGGEAGELDQQDELLRRLHRVRVQGVRGHLETARVVLQRHLDRKEFASVTEVGAQTVTDLVPRAEPLGLEAEVREKVNGFRTQALRARLEQARIEAREHLRQDRFQAVGQVGEKAFEQLAGESRLLGMEQAVLAFRDSCRVFADLAKKAKVVDQK
jgi:hypothetical protein